MRLRYAWLVWCALNRNCNWSFHSEIISPIRKFSLMSTILAVHRLFGSVNVYCTNTLLYRMTFVTWSWNVLHCPHDQQLCTGCRQLFAIVTGLSLPPFFERLTFSAELNSAMFRIFGHYVPMWMSWCVCEYLLDCAVVAETPPIGW